MARDDTNTTDVSLDGQRNSGSEGVRRDEDAGNVVCPASSPPPPAALKSLTLEESLLSGAEKDWRVEVAWHEAGHAVVAWALALDIYNITAFPPEYGGNGGLPSGWSQQGYVVLEKSEGVQSILVTLAGPAAQLVVNEEAGSNSGWLHDFRRIDTELVRLGLDMTYVPTLWRRVNRLVDRYLPVILLMAEQLLQNRSMDIEDMSLIPQWMRQRRLGALSSGQLQKVLAVPRQRTWRIASAVPAAVCDYLHEAMDLRGVSDEELAS